MHTCVRRCMPYRTEQDGGGGVGIPAQTIKVEMFLFCVVADSDYSNTAFVHWLAAVCLRRSFQRTGTMKSKETRKQIGIRPTTTVQTCVSKHVNLRSIPTVKKTKHVAPLCVEPRRGGEVDRGMVLRSATWRGPERPCGIFDVTRPCGWLCHSVLRSLEERQGDGNEGKGPSCSRVVPVSSVQTRRGVK